MTENNNATLQNTPEKKKLQWNTIILGALALLAVVAAIAYFVLNQNKAPSVKPNAGNGNHTSNIDTNITQTAEEKGEEVLLQAEKQKLVEKLNENLLPNYIKISKWNEFPKFGTYSAENVTFFTLSFEPLVTNETLADYATYVSRDIAYEEDFEKADALYKAQIENNLRAEVMNGFMAKIMQKGVIGIITSKWGNDHEIDFLGDYIIKTWGEKKDISATLAGKIALLGDYFNFGETYLSKEAKEFDRLLEQVKTELNDKEFTTLAENIKKVYFNNIQ